MRKAAKITISLPVELLKAIAQRLLEAALRREREQADVERYIRGYLEQPETEDEVAAIDRLSVEAATWDPWP